MTTPVAASGRPLTVGGSASHSPSNAEDRARAERMVHAVRRLGEQLAETHSTLDVFVERLSDAARDAQAAPVVDAAPVPSPAGPSPSRAVRPAVGTPVRRPDPVEPAEGGRPAPPAGLAEHVR